MDIPNLYQADFRLGGKGKSRRPIEPVPHSSSKLLRIVASGTLFQTFTLSVPHHPGPSSVIRAHSVTKTRGGSASTLLSLVTQFPSVEAALVAPLGGDEEGRNVKAELEKERVSTRFCKIWKGLGVPSAWVLDADNNTRTVINHNPLPDISHEEFIALLGPVLAPENYMAMTEANNLGSNPQSPPVTSPSGFTTLPESPAPFDWIHFEGRSVKTTLSNISGLEGLARERHWRSHCVFSLDVGRKSRQGVEALIPHADVIFVNKHYAQYSSAPNPRAFLLSLTSIAPPHALLVAHWGSEGAALLSLPTQEYLQSSAWVGTDPHAGGRSASTSNQDDSRYLDSQGEVISVRSGSDYWANGRQTPSSSDNTFRSSYLTSDEDQTGSDGSGETETPDDNEEVLDEIGSQEAFVAGMIYALSRQIMPGGPYVPSAGVNKHASDKQQEGRWRLEECLRFATELAGRKARRRTWDGLAVEMARSGWFNH